eukprot:11212488-Lingulodinium_polyedra.AAC.1
MPGVRGKQDRKATRIVKLPKALSIENVRALCPKGGQIYWRHHDNRPRGYYSTAGGGRPSTSAS